MTDHWKDPVFKPGDVVVCKATCYDYNIKEGKHYTVIDYDPPDTTGVGFTFPAYVTFDDDLGRRRVGHARRFKAVDA